MRLSPVGTLEAETQAALEVHVSFLRVVARGPHCLTQRPNFDNLKSAARCTLRWPR